MNNQTSIDSLTREQFEAYDKVNDITIALGKIDKQIILKKNDIIHKGILAAAVGGLGYMGYNYDVVGSIMYGIGAGLLLIMGGISGYVCHDMKKMKNKLQGKLSAYKENPDYIEAIKFKNMG
ncbi:hypothetical protein ACFL1H_03140 [Nanoarchaeota archaeon]